MNKVKTRWLFSFGLLMNGDKDPQDHDLIQAQKRGGKQTPDCYNLQIPSITPHTQTLRLTYAFQAYHDL